MCKSGLYIITYFKHEKYFIRGLLVFSLLVFSVFKYLQFIFSSNFSCSGNVKVLVCRLYMPGLLDMLEILDNIYIWVFSIISESVLLLALVKYILCSHFTQNCMFCTFWRLKILVLWRKIVENLLIFVYLFCPKNDAIDFTKTFKTQEWLVVESCPTPRWITFLMLYQLVYNIRSHFN